MPITIVGNNFTLAIEEKEKLAVVLAIQEHLIDNHMRAENILDLFDEIDTNGDPIPTPNPNPKKPEPEPEPEPEPDPSPTLTLTLTLTLIRKPRD